MGHVGGDGGLVGDEPLATTGPDNGAKPWLAESWVPNPDFTNWAIYLKDGVTFQNGEKLDAAAVKMNIDDAVSGPLSSQALAGLFKQVSVVDDKTVLVELTQPSAVFPSSFLDGQSAMMMAPAMLKSADHGQTHPIGTGPFAFDSWQPGDTFKTKKNTTYWQQGLPHLDELAFKVIPDSATRTAAMESGDINMMLTSSVVDANKLAGDYTVVRDWDTEPGMVILNTAPKTAKGEANPLNNLHAASNPPAIRGRDRSAGDRRQHRRGRPDPDLAVLPGQPVGPAEGPERLPGLRPREGQGRGRGLRVRDGCVVAQLLPEGRRRRGHPVGDAAPAESVEAGRHRRQHPGDRERLVHHPGGVGRVRVGLLPGVHRPRPDQDHYFWSDTVKGPGGVNINFAQDTTPQIEADLKQGRQSGYIDQRKDAYHDLVKQLNAGAVNIWTYWTPWSIVAEKNVHGLAEAGQVPFANFQPKTWFANLWRSQ